MLLFALTLVVAPGAANPSAGSPTVPVRSKEETLAHEGPGSEASEVLYSFARRLSDSELQVAAARYYVAVALRGPADPFFEPALVQLILGAQATGDWTEVDDVASAIQPESSSCCATALSYRIGLQLIAAGDLAAGTAILSGASTSDSTYKRSKLLAAAAFTRQGKLKSAVRSYTDVVRHSESLPSAAELAAADTRRVRAVEGIARIYAGIGQLDEAGKYFGTVPRTSIYGPQAAVELAWVRLMARDLDGVGAALATLDARPQAWLPEGDLLRAAHALARGEDAGVALTRIHTMVDPVRAELTSTLRVSDSVAARRTFQLLPKGFAMRLRRDEEIDDLLRAISEVDRELAAIRAPKWKWISAGLGRELEVRRGALEVRSGARLLRLYQIHLAVLDRLVLQAEGLGAPAPVGEHAAARLERIMELMVEVPVDPEGAAPLRRGAVVVMPG